MPPENKKEKVKKTEKRIEDKPEEKPAEKGAEKPETKPKEQQPEKEKPAGEKEAPKEASKEPPKFEVTDFNPWTVLRYPHLTEKSMNMVELENKLVFIADRRAKKEQIKEAIEKGFNVKVDTLSVVITQKGLKKAYAKLNEANDATDIASRLGML